MIEILQLATPAAPEAGRAVEVLEAGGVVWLPDHPFAILASEGHFLDPAVLASKSKNVSLDPAGIDLAGTALEGAARTLLANMLSRYAGFAQALMATIAPEYSPALQRRRTSFRPAPVDTRVLSLRKDDRRLHVDAFPANPVQGRRILRVFSNVDPLGRPRCWEVGEDDFATLAHDARRGLAPHAPFAAWARERLGLTKGRRTAYDDAMMKIHDRAKLDDAFQARANKQKLNFLPGSTWVAYTDAVLHAALAGQYAFEQTYLLPVEGMRCPERSPLRVLERLSGRMLA